MNLFSKFGVGAAVALAGFTASATTLTFDTLDYVNAATVLSYPSFYPAYSATASTITYAEQGYAFTLHTSGLYSDPHTGDAGNYQTFNWHDDGGNNPGAYVTLSRVGGGTFNLLSFDYDSQFSAYPNSMTTLSAAGYSSIILAPGTVSPLFSNVSSVTFASIGYRYNQLDNFNVTPGVMAAVPEPETYAMLAAGLGMMGFIARRRRKSA